MIRKTSSEIGSLAGSVLQNKNSSQIQKELAASALSQMNTGNKTGGQMEDTASKVLNSEKYSDITKSLAGSILSQSVKER
jgi:hypothetical protein